MRCSKRYYSSCWYKREPTDDVIQVEYEQKEGQLPSLRPFILAKYTNLCHYIFCKTNKDFKEKRLGRFVFIFFFFVCGCCRSHVRIYQVSD